MTSKSSHPTDKVFNKSNAPPETTAPVVISSKTDNMVPTQVVPAPPQKLAKTVKPRATEPPKLSVEKKYGESMMGRYVQELDDGDVFNFELQEHGDFELMISSGGQELVKNYQSDYNPIKSNWGWNNANKWMVDGEGKNHFRDFSSKFLVS